MSIHVRGPAVPSDKPDAGSDTADVAAAVDAAFAELAWVDGVFSRYRPDSAVSRLRAGRLDIADCPDEVAEVVALCRIASERTAGAFAWWLPDETGSLRLEPTGLVKGWALERAATWLRRLDGHAFCLNAGGDIVVGGGDVADPLRPWRIGIENPRDRSRVAHVVELTDGAVATSGTAARGAHLVDPVTGQPITRLGSVTVVGPSILWADVWATALFVGPRRLTARLTRAEAWQVIRL